MVGGIVLCGGQSRRMGRSKAWLPFGSEVLLQRVVRILGAEARPIVVVAGPEQDLPELPDQVAIVRDPVADLGPLPGLAAGLKVLVDAVELVYLSATDAPFLQPGWVTHLSETIGEADLAIPEIGGFFHPLSAIYRCRTVLPEAEAMISEGRLRMVDLAERVRTIRVEASELVAIDPALQTLRNLNTPADYERAILDLSRISESDPRENTEEITERKQFESLLF